MGRHSRAYGRRGGIFDLRRPLGANPAFTLIELLVVMAIVSLLISILMPALGRARETSRRTVCATNLRSVAIAFTQYAQDNDGWFPAKPKENSPNALMTEMATVQDKASSLSLNWADRWGPNFAGMIRDLVEKRATRNPSDPVPPSQMTNLPDNGPPQYIMDPRVLLCPSDKANNRPKSNNPSDVWRTLAVNSYRELPLTVSQEAQTKRSFISYFYIALWRTDDRPDWLLMADQSNRNDTMVRSFTQLDSEDNHGARGMNIAILDTHVEWGATRSGGTDDMQALANKYWGGIVQSNPRYPGTTGNRSSEVQTIE